MLGSVELRRHDEDHGVGEVAYAVGAADRGRGVARRAVGLVCAWAFGEVGLRRIELLTHLDNVASQRVAAACGFACEGVRPSARVVRGRSVDLVIFALDRY